MVEPSLVLYGSLYERALGLLEETLRETGARYALLIDRKGFVLAHKEALWAPKPPPLDSLATLVAGNAAATQALAKLLGRPASRSWSTRGRGWASTWTRPGSTPSSSWSLTRTPPRQGEALRKAGGGGPG